MWLALAKVSADHAKIARNMMTCARNGAQEAENRGDWEIAVKFWQDCGTVDATSDAGKKALERSLVYRARAAERDGSPTLAREFWAAMLKDYPADIRAKLGLLRTGGNFEGGSRIDAILRSVAQKARTTSSSFYFDVSDVVMYFRAARDADRHPENHPGCHRRGVCRWAGQSGFMHLRPQVRCLESGEYRTVPASRALVAGRFGRHRPHNGCRRSTVSRTSSRIRRRSFFGRWHCRQSPGSPWDVPNYFLAVREAKRRSNIFYAGFVHDTIPLLHPEFCNGETADVYATWLAGIGAHADFTFANAENTRRDFLGALTKVGKAPIPCEVVFPNGSFAADTEVTDTLSEDVQAAIKDGYALFVGTIEPRKDHLFVLAAWQRLLVELTPARVPTLVIAGSLGWHCEPVVEFIKTTASLGGKLKVLNKVSDVDLQALYKGIAPYGTTVITKAGDCRLPRASRTRRCPFCRGTRV